MIKNIIFDYGDVFINLNKQATLRKLAAFGVTEFTKNDYSILYDYEKGLISTKRFLKSFTNNYPQVKHKDLIDAWNAILLDFPLYRMKFIKDLAASKKYRLFLLSNTNDLHISRIQQNWGTALYNEFKNCFERFYLSYEIHLRKPDKEIYEFVLYEGHLVADETFFIDDTKENTDAALQLGIHVWNIDPATEDVVELPAHKEFKK